MDEGQSLKEMLKGHGRNIASQMFQQLVTGHENMKQVSLSADICYHAAIHVLATHYFNDVTMAMRKNGPISKEKFLNAVLEDIEKEHDFIKTEGDLEKVEVSNDPDTNLN